MGVFKGILTSIIAIGITFCIIVAIEGILFDDCDDFLNVALARRDLNPFILTEISGGEVLLTCVLFLILTFLHLSALKWLYLSITWQLLFHCCVHGFAFFIIIRVPDPSNKDIVVSYDVELRSSEPDIIVPTWLQYLYIQRNCCGIYNHYIDELPMKDKNFNYLQSIDDTLKRLSCPEQEPSSRSQIFPPEIQLNFYGDVKNFQIAYNRVRNQGSSRQKLRERIETSANTGKNGCGDEIRQIYEDCMGKCLRNVVLSLIFGFVPLVCFLVVWKAERRNDTTSTESENQVENEQNTEKSKESDIENQNEQEEEHRNRENETNDSEDEEVII